VGRAGGTSDNTTKPRSGITVRNDRLGKLVLELTAQFESASSWEEFVTSFRGEPYLSQNLNHVDHPAAALLREWRDNGVPVHTSYPHWTQEQKDAAVLKGCHRSSYDLPTTSTPGSSPCCPTESSDTLSI
jgi:hypothetical protein